MMVKRSNRVHQTRSRKNGVWCTSMAVLTKPTLGDPARQATVSVHRNVEGVRANALSVMAYRTAYEHQLRGGF